MSFALSFRVKTGGSSSVHGNRINTTALISAAAGLRTSHIETLIREKGIGLLKILFTRSVLANSAEKEMTQPTEKNHGAAMHIAVHTSSGAISSSTLRKIISVAIRQQPTQIL